MVRWRRLRVYSISCRHCGAVLGMMSVARWLGEVSCGACKADSRRVRPFWERRDSQADRRDVGRLRRGEDASFLQAGFSRKDAAQWRRLLSRGSRRIRTRAARREDQTKRLRVALKPTWTPAARGGVSGWVERTGREFHKPRPPGGLPRQ